MVLLLEVLVVGLVLFGIAVLATGRGDGMADAPPDRVTPALPSGRVRADDLDRVRFPLAFRGYRMADVDLVLDRLGDELRRRDSEIERLRGSGGAKAPAGPAAPASQVGPSELGTPKLDG